VDLSPCYCPVRTERLLAAIGSPLAALFLLSGAASTQVRAEPQSAMGAPAACWSPVNLRYKRGDEAVHRGIAEAFLDPTPREVPPYEPRKQRGVLRRVKLPPGKKLIALTFDLCEHPYEVTGYEGRIVDFLRSNNIKATFFAGGKWLLSHRDRAQQLMADPLFQMGNHTWEYRNLRIVDAACNRRALDEVEGLVPIQWDISSGDPGSGRMAAAGIPRAPCPPLLAF
jgi:Polysaccharide deacetylase